jgi:hypothetical protein
MPAGLAPAGVVFMIGISMAETEGNLAIIFGKSALILKVVRGFFRERGLTRFPHHLRWGQMRASLAIRAQGKG